MADALIALRPIGLPPFTIQVNNRKVPEGFYLGLGLTDVVGVAADRRQARQDRAGAGRAALLEEAGADAGAGARPASRWPGSARRTPRSSTGCAPSASSTRLLDEGLARAGARSSRPAAEHAPGVAGRGPADRARPGLLHGHGLRDASWTGCPTSARSAPGAATTRWPATAGTPTRASGISIGVTPARRRRCVGRGLGRRRPGPCRRCVLVAVPDEKRRPDCDRIAARLRRRGIPVEVAPSAAKYGKQIRHADRRGIPFVWFPGEDGPRPGQGHPLRRPGRRGRRQLAAARTGPVAAGGPRLTAVSGEQARVLVQEVDPPPGGPAPKLQPRACRMPWIAVPCVVADEDVPVDGEVGPAAVGEGS